MIVLGIDPGYALMGWGVVEGQAGRLRLLGYGCVETKAGVPMQHRLRTLQLGVRNLVLYHTEDQTIRQRKTRYMAEGKQYFHGNLYIPEDLEVLEL